MGGRTRMDLIQDVLLTLCEKEADPENPFFFDTVTRPFLRTRVFQVLCNIYSRDCKIATRWELNPEAEVEDSLVDLENDELIKGVMDKIDKLPDDNRTIMRMRAMEYSYEEISEALEDDRIYLSPLAIRQRVFQIRKKITGEMAEG
jgi:DNA-directed RNA polymerase specialized sigma24 family protein